MKIKLLSLITIAITTIACLSGCNQSSMGNQAITTIIATGTGLAFQYVPMGSNKQLIAKYVSGIAGGARALTGNETDAEAAQLLASYVPSDVLTQFPAIGTTVIPQVVGYYQNAKKEFGTNHQGFVDRMNAVASGLEQGVSSFIN